MEPNELYGWILQWLQAHVGQAIAYPLLALLLAGAGIMAWKAAKKAATKVTAFVEKLDIFVDATTVAIESGKKTAQTVQELHDIQAFQAENHLHTIEAATVATKEETIKTNAKLDVLIDIMGRRA